MLSNLATALLVGGLGLGRTHGPSDQYQCAYAPPTIGEVRYEMALHIDYDQAMISGNVNLTVTNTGDEPRSSVPLLLYRLMSVESVTDGSGTALQFGERVTVLEDRSKLQVNHVEVALPTPLLPGGEATLHMAYGGHLLGYTETGMLYVRDHVDPTFTILRPDALAYPRVGVPCRAANRAVDRAEFDYRVSVDVPDSLVVANGGRLVARDEHDGRVTYTYANGHPAWRMDFAIAPYGLQERAGHRVFYLPGDSLGAARVLEAVEASAALFSDWLGPQAEAQGLTVIEIPDGWGSQKDVTTIIQTAAAFRDPERMSELYHEVSHFWNVADLDRPSPRWNEGLASYLEELAGEELNGVEVVAPRVETVTRWLRDRLQRRPQLSRVPLIDYGREQMTDFSYSVGMVFFAALHELAGDEGFREIVGGFYQRYHRDGATTDQFAEYARSAGPPAIEALLRDWIYTVGWVAVVSENETLDGIVAHYRGG